jgi:hypothetical protein
MNALPSFLTVFWSGRVYQPAFLTKLLLRRPHGTPCLAFARSGCST